MVIIVNYSWTVNISNEGEAVLRDRVSSFIAYHVQSSVSRLLVTIYVKQVNIDSSNFRYI